jgi:dihydrodipicolinate synthase/N-acetylneuraminate lyase
MKEIKGVLPCILTPYDTNFKVDSEDYQRQVDFIYEAGCQGVVVGQVSEVMRLSQSERYEVAKLLVQCNKGRGITVMSTGAESTHAAIEYSVQAEEVGIDALLLMHPSTMALSEDQMFKYFSDVIKETTIPVIVHHAKSYAKNPLSVDTQVRILNEFGDKRILFKPESSPTPPKLSLLRDKSDNCAKIFEGDGGMMLMDCHKRGLKGTIPAAETAKIVNQLWLALEEGDLDKSRKITFPLSYLMCQMMNSVDCYQFLAKHLLKRAGIMKNALVRGPHDYIPDTETLREVEITYDHILSLLD